MIDTVTGKIPLEELGQTLIHEHITCSGSEFHACFPDWPPRETILKIAVAKLKYAAEKFQIRTMIDGTPYILGRDLDLLKEASERSGVQIVASAGFYYYDSFTVVKASEETMAELIADEIRNGKIPPAMLKCAVDAAGVTPLVEKMLRTIALVHRKTGLPVYCHTCSALRTGIKAQKVLEDAGVPPEKCVLGHVSDSNDPDYALALLETGSFVAIDRVHGHNAAFAAELIRSGHEDRIFLSHDHVCCYDTVMNTPSAPQNEPYGLDAVHGRILPEMRRLGIAENAIEKIITKNIISLYRG